MEMFTIIIGQQIMEYYTTWFAQFMSDIEQTMYGRQLPIWLCTNERFIYQITIQFYYYTLLKVQYTVGPGELYSLNKNRSPCGIKSNRVDALERLSSGIGLSNAKAILI